MEAELQRLVDHREISDLLVDYCTYVDRYDTDKIATLFTEDCEYDFGPAFGGRQKGSARLARGAAHTLAAWRATSHHVSNIRIWFEGRDDARAETYLYAWHRPHDDDEPDFELWARYRDRLVRTQAGWRIRERVLVAAGQAGASHPFVPLERAEVRG